MKADDIVNFIVKETAPRYNGLQDKEKKLFHAILQSIPSDNLPEVIEKLESDKSVPWELWGFINWMRMDHSSKKERPNEPISTLLRWYEDKKSKKVSYSYERLSKRFDGQSFSDQKRILRAFLEGGKKSSEWAAARLRDNWIPGLEEEIKTAWAKHKGSSMARTIIYMMPEEFVMQEQEDLVKAASDLSDAYAILCGRLGHTPGFVIDEERLSLLDWFYVVGKLHLVERENEMDEKAAQFIRSQDCVDYIMTENTSGNSLLYYIGMGRIIWAMKQLGYTEGLIRLARLEQDAISLVYASGVKEFKTASAVYFLKSLLENDIYDEEDYGRTVEVWRSKYEEDH